jgi:hypothetical protein
MRKVFNFKIVRSFSLGFCIFSPKLNGFYMELYFGCLHIGIYGKGEGLIEFNNYWN